MRAPDSEPWLISDFLTPRESHRTPLYGEFFSAVEVEDRTTAFSPIGRFVAVVPTLGWRVVTNNDSGNSHAVNWAMIGALAAVVGVVVAVLVARGTFSPSPTPTPTPSPTTVPVTPTGPPHPPSAVYLSDLEPTAGDTPMVGDTHIGDQDFRHSIFYNNVPLNEPNGSASACQKVAASTCQATDYSIASGRYHQFSAMLGVTDEGDSEMARWLLSVDGVVVRSGTVALNSSPQRITVAIPQGNDLELQVSTSAYSGGAYGGLNIIWGNAQLSY